MFNISAVVVAGQPATGKSAAVRMVLAAFNSRSLGSCDIKLTRVYPGAFEDPDLFCGHVCQSGEWREGVLTNLIKKAQKVCRNKAQGLFLTSSPSSSPTSSFSPSSSSFPSYSFPSFLPSPFLLLLLLLLPQTTQTLSWVCMDGPLLPSWLDSITGLLGSAQVSSHVHTHTHTHTHTHAHTHM